jgi:hypothetical protein
LPSSSRGWQLRKIDAHLRMLHAAPIPDAAVVQKAPMMLSLLVAALNFKKSPIEGQINIHLSGRSASGAWRMATTR